MTDRMVIRIVVFVAGLSTLGIEISASRLLGNIFGTSNLVWANVIGLILLYLTVGYYVGGKWADRSPHFKTFFTIIIWAAFLTALIPLLTKPVLTFAAQAVVGAQAALALGSFISVMILFSAPVTLLGCISPFAIRLAVTDTQHTGEVVGQIYAISTLGSLLGTFIPVLFLIPTIGTFRTFMLFAGLLYLVAFVGLYQISLMQAIRWLWMPLVIVLASVWALNGPLRPPIDGSELLYDSESGYNYIQVQEDADGYRYLYLNEGQGVHSMWHESEYLYDGTWDMFLVAPYFNNPPFRPEYLDKVLVIGLAAGTIPRQHQHVYGTQLEMDGIEIDPEIVEVASIFFDMNDEMMPNLNVVVGDGRYELRRLSDRYSLIAIDAYRPPYIPWHLTTVEYFEEIRGLLLPNGVVAVNVGRTSTDRRLVDAMSGTLMQVFPSVHAIDVPRSFNTILVGTVQPTSPYNLGQNHNLISKIDYPELERVVSRTLSDLVTVEKSDVVFTDDLAPVETLIDSLVLNFLISGDMDELR